MRHLIHRLNPGDYDTSHTLVIRKVKPSSASDIWRHKQGTLRRYGLPNGRDHTAECMCRKRKDKSMPKIATIKVGTRNRAKSASRVEFLFDWAELFDTDGDYYQPMVSKGIVLTEGEDYIITDADGNPISLKSGPEKVRREVIRHVVDNLNCPVSVKVPETGQNVSTADRKWVMFRPRIDVPFTSENARAEYLDKNGITTTSDSLANGSESEEE